MAEEAKDENLEAEKGQLHETRLYYDVAETQWPIIYIVDYNIGFMGIERLHPFDAGKWGRVFEFLKAAGMIRDDTTVRPREASPADLMVVHPKEYLDSLKLTSIVEGIQEWSLNVAGITEVPPVALLPNFLVQRKVLRPFRLQTGGTVLAGKLAVERGWAVNIGGGFHHCSSERGGGFCAYADITLCIRFLFDRIKSIKNAMIIDLDAHQGNGHERDFMNDQRVYILDMYNRGIYPHDGFAKRCKAPCHVMTQGKEGDKKEILRNSENDSIFLQLSFGNNQGAIKRKIELMHFTEDREYLDLVRRHVEGALNEFTPDVIVYNAGTDILDGDPLGCLSISPQGIIERDQIVFQKARTRGIPIVMVTSGGYQRTTARIIADSLLNLRALGLITCDEAENAPLPPELLPPSSIPRSASDGGLWARFKRSTNCANMTHSQTQDQLNAASRDAQTPEGPT